jgi:hypothetical protein
MQKPMLTSMEMSPMSNVISMAQRIAERADKRAEAYRKRAMSDNFMDETETETYRDMRATARELEQFADVQDLAYSLGRVGMTERNVRRLSDYMHLDDSIA